MTQHRCQDVTRIDSAVVVVAAKSISDASAVKPFPPDPNSSQSTISTVEREIREAGGDALSISVDVRDHQSIQNMVHDTIKVQTSDDFLLFYSEHIAEMWSTRCAHLQLGCNLVGFSGDYINETISAHATSQSGGSLCNSPSGPTLLQAERVGREDRRRQSTYIFTLL